MCSHRLSVSETISFEIDVMGMNRKTADRFGLARSEIVQGRSSGSDASQAKRFSFCVRLRVKGMHCPHDAMQFGKYPLVIARNQRDSVRSIWNLLPSTP